MKTGEWIRKAMEEAPGVPSSVRLQMLAVAAVCLVVLLAFSAAIVAGKRDDIPAGVITLCSLLFTGAAAAKVVQQRSE